MPIVHFKPMGKKKAGTDGVYQCPLYMYPIRTGSRERPSFITWVEVKSGAKDAAFWIKRGTALLLATGKRALAAPAERTDRARTLRDSNRSGLPQSGSHRVPVARKALFPLRGRGSLSLFVRQPTPFLRGARTAA